LAVGQGVLDGKEFVADLDDTFKRFRDLLSDAVGG